MPYGIKQRYTDEDSPHPALTPARGRYTRFTWPSGMQGLVDLGDQLHAEIVYQPTDDQPFK